MEIHILNGDALKEQFPLSLSGELIVMRECLVDGEPRGEDLDALMEELGREQFGPVFRVFNTRESIYGYGDLQVKRLFDELKSNV